MKGLSVLVVDNYDSFAYNLVQYVGEIVTTEAWYESGSSGGASGAVIVRRNDAIDIEGIRDLDPDAIVVSPGPGTPEEAGVSMAIFEQLSIPALGVCLGHQALCAANGAPVGHAPDVVHGKPSTITHDGQGIFTQLPAAFDVGRYHSLAVERTALPDSLTETARTDDERSIVMAVRHESRPHVGVQFHPESILTDHGKQLVASFFREYC
ncbi:anthranilate synthase component II [Halapricum hydrolyticum]|uniref:Anthranilate synthase component II n=1 Tax=Halapricum hydrolyticum TaxID=2979991 RepID=A0AAE3LHB7_9EURY|nr:aminodeoxychorismate/anthranilate synthase component II [Halapricum hydrolyticum]MCU4717707.1 aminodeoxychorismate/anthranilate synthase component II [Halapricum hydrolyticum]MCU4726764.1 aminodeoxychorismate/anthranilate synthase component II [Halapricum hydrolyticum]